MNANGERWRYLIVKTVSALLRGIMSQPLGYFYCLNCLRSLATKTKLEFRKAYVKI